MIVAALLMLAQAEPWTANAPWRLYGPANQSCGEWLLHKNDEAHRLSQLSWAGGFLSGINLAAGGKVTDVDAPSLIAYIDQQCTARPLEKVAGVIVEFYYHTNKP